MKIALFTLRSVAYALTEPYWVFMLVILAFILYRQNKKTSLMQKMIVGERLNSPIELTVSQIVIGIFAGAIGSVLLAYLGVVFNENSSVDLVFLISILLMVWGQRFVCFAYSGGVLALFSLILDKLAQLYSGTTVHLFGYNLNLANLDIFKIDVVALMTMIAVLHFVEGILVIIDGKRGAIPVFTNRDDKIIGGFALQRYWVLPTALLIMLSSANAGFVGEQTATPNWWPLVKTSIPPNILRDALITLIPFYGVIGYNSVTFTKNKSEKSLLSGLIIIIFSGILYTFAQLASLNFILKLFVAILAPLGHEAMLNLQKYAEIKGKPRYINSDEGIMVLEVAPSSPAHEMGIKSGDVLVAINNRQIDNEQDILDIVKEGASFLWLKIKTGENGIREVSYNKMNEGKRLGIVFVPKNIPGESMIVKLNETRFEEVLDKIKKKDKEE